MSKRIWHDELEYWRQDEEKDAAEAGRPPRPDEPLHMVVYVAITEFLEENWDAIWAGMADERWDYDTFILQWMQQREATSTPEPEPVKV